jgi:7-cyano-7-deazaguanine synthase
MKTYAAIVVFSGGQDSTTCLGTAIYYHGASNILAVAFDYGQKHRIELEQARLIAAKLGVDFTVVDVPALRLMESSGLVTGGDVSSGHEYLKDLPASFVPARNALFLTIAYGLAMEAKANRIYTGVCQTDYSGYPDCRDEFVRALNTALDIGYQSTIHIMTPLMNLTKAETFELAASVGILDVVLADSHTCYNGNRDGIHPWGRGCGTCPACMLRAKGYAEYMAEPA